MQNYKIKSKIIDETNFKNNSKSGIDLAKSLKSNSHFLSEK